MSGFAIWPPSNSTVSAATLAREMMALTQATLSPPPFPEDAARGDGQPVIVIPGFLAPDMSTVRLKLYKGNADVVGRTSPYSLYSEKLVTFEDDQGAYDQKDAAGFIKLNALRLRTLAMRKRQSGK